LVPLEFAVEVEGPFSLEYTLQSGQTFRWERRGEWWVGVVSGGCLKVRQEGDVLRCSSSSSTIDTSFVRSYFKLETDLEPILESITKDQVMAKAVERFYGLRIVRQERWECLASFILATNANIPRIGKMVEAVCSKLGTPFEYDGTTFHSFPPPESVASARLSDLRRAGLGYRAPFLKGVAAKVSSGAVDLDAIGEQGYDGAKKSLLNELLGEKVLKGVGPKVADCVMLFSLEKDEAFPIDVWIAKSISKEYPHLLPGGAGNRKLGPGSYAKVSLALRAYFGKYAGYAQQYLFMAARTDGT